MNINRSLPRLAYSILAASFVSVAVAAPSVYPTGTTIYDPERAWNGYTIYIALEEEGAVLIDMNGNALKVWEGFHGGAGGPARILPGGYVLSAGPTKPPNQESADLIQFDWDGNTVWSFNRVEEMEAADGSTYWSARQHHDWQREGLHGGYYSPIAEPRVDGGRTMFLSHKDVNVPEISDRTLGDDYIVEVDWEGNITWEWLASDHVDELGFSRDAREVIHAAPGFSRARGSFDWLHINSATYVGPNKWYDDGDQRFHPDNVVISSRTAGIVAIIAREDGSIVWRMGPDYRETPETAAIGQVVGQHNPHIIPKGLPGEGNMLVFDNGGSSGFGRADGTAPSGSGINGRANSRVLEIDPQTMELVWSYSQPGRESFKFFSGYISSMQRLPNGNTMITEGAGGRLFEVTPDGDTVWEYISPIFVMREALSNAVYRAYRLPYDWVPQLDEPEERAVVPPALSEFRIEPQ